MNKYAKIGKPKIYIMIMQYAVSKYIMTFSS